MSHAFGRLSGHSSLGDPIDLGGTGDVINHAFGTLPKSVHVDNKLSKKLFTFVAWAPLPRSPLPDPGSHPSQKLIILITIS